MRITFSTGSVSMVESAQIISMEVRGIVSASDMIEIAHKMAALKIPIEGRGVVWRLDQAVWAEGKLTSQEYVALFPYVPTWTDWPGAIVVDPSVQVWWRGYVMGQAQRGLVRGLFTDFEPACAWARAKARIARAALDHLSQTQPTERTARKPVVFDLHLASHRAFAPHPARAG